MTAKTRKRLQLDASSELSSNLEELTKLIDSSSTAETIRRAVRLALELAREHKDGKLEFIAKDGKSKILVLFF